MNDIKKLILNDVYPKLTPELYKESYKKSRLFQNYILKHIDEIMMPCTLIEETLILAKEIHNEIESLYRGFQTITE